MDLVIFCELNMAYIYLASIAPKFWKDLFQYPFQSNVFILFAFLEHIRLIANEYNFPEIPATWTFDFWGFNCFCKLTILMQDMEAQ